MSPLVCSFTSLFGQQVLPEAPAFGPEEVGLRLAARDVSFDGANLRLTLLLSHSLDNGLRSLFRRAERAVICVVEDGVTGEAVHFAAVDPFREWGDMAAPNYRGGTPAGSVTPGATGGCLSIPLAITAAPPPAPGHSIYFTALLRDQVSNTLAVDLDAASTAAFLEGREVRLFTEADLRAVLAVAEPLDDDGSPEPPDEDPPLPDPPPDATPAPITPAPGGPFVISARRPGAQPTGQPQPLDGRLTLTPEEFAPLGAEGWLRPSFVCATPESGGLARIANLTGDRVVFPDEGTPAGAGDQGRAFAFEVDLSRVFDAPLETGRWFVQLSARHHRSNVLEVQCP